MICSASCASGERHLLALAELILETPPLLLGGTVRGVRGEHFGERVEQLPLLLQEGAFVGPRTFPEIGHLDEPAAFARDQIGREFPRRFAPARGLHFEVAINDARFAALRILPRGRDFFDQRFEKVLIESTPALHEP